jgi:hypothetical protein
LAWAAARASAIEPASLPQQRVERLAFDQLHRDERRPRSKRLLRPEHVFLSWLDFRDLVDRADRRVVERRGHPRLAQEAGTCLVLSPEARRHELDRNRPMELSVGRAVYDAHPALAKPSELGIPRKHGRASLGGYYCDFLQRRTRPAYRSSEARSCLSDWAFTHEPPGWLNRRWGERR